MDCVLALQDASKHRRFEPLLWGYGERKTQSQRLRSAQT